MLIVKFIFEDLLDQNRVDGVEATAHALVVGRWRERITADDVDDDLEMGGVSVPKEGVNGLLPDFQRGVRVSLDGESDDNGELTFRFNLDSAFREVSMLEKDGIAPEDVGALLSVDARVEGMAFKVQFVNDAFEETSANFLGRNASVTRRVPVDFGKVIVGHVTDTTARLFFRLHVEIGLGDYVCEIRERDLIPLHSSHVFRPNPGAVNTAIVDVGCLQPDRTYDFRVFVRANTDVDVPGAGRPLLSGEFRTNNPNAEAVVFVFGSCHNPASLSPLSRDLVLSAWRAVAEQCDYEMLLLIGDQIYGDGIDLPSNNLTWRDRYLSRYDRFFIYPELRQILRRTPTYMMIDDHEVVDDYGVVPVEELVEPANKSDGNQRLVSALQAYEVFQKSHSPLGEGEADSAKHYDFNHGPAAFFMIDNRTRRAPNPEGDLDPSEPILGFEQKADLRDWATRTLNSDTDVIFVSTPVPIAFLPVEQVRRLVDELKESGTGLGASGGSALGAVVGGLAGGPFGALAGSGVGAIVGGSFGYFVARSKINSKGLGDFTTRDLADMWTFKPNQKDMVFLLDLLFDIANDIRPDGTQGDRPRAVFLLGGDVHLGVLHMLRSFRERHRRNPLILQAISSPISNNPVDEESLSTVLKKIQTNSDVGILDLVKGKLQIDGILDSVFGDAGNAAFVLDDVLEARYAADFMGVLTERNFGRVSVSRVPGSGRTYRCSFTIQGQTAIDSDFLLDLNANQIAPIHDHAVFVRQSVPKKIKPLEQVKVSVTMRNAGTTGWSRRYHLKSLTNDWLVQKVTLPRSPVEPGEEVTFEFTIFAQSVGDFTFQWRMSQTFSDPFGQASRRTTISADSSLSGSAACAEIRVQLRAAMSELRSLQSELAGASPSEKPFIASLIKSAQSRLSALEKRARQLNCQR